MNKIKSDASLKVKICQLAGSHQRAIRKDQRAHQD